MTTTGIKVTDDMRERIKALGEKMDRSPHWIMKAAIEKYLVEQERYWREREEDDERWRNYLRAGNGVPHEKVAAWLRSIGTADEKEWP